MIKTDARLWKKHASPRLLERHEKTLVTPADDQVLIENRAIGLNPVDWKLMAGLSDARQGGSDPRRRRYGGDYRRWPQRPPPSSRHASDVSHRPAFLTVALPAIR